MEIIGVYPIEAAEPCHMVEVIIGSSIKHFDWGGVTQEVENQPMDNWQVAYDEKLISKEKSNWIFFFHYIDFTKPLITPEGNVVLPAPSPLPDRLKDIEYEEP